MKADGEQACALRSASLPSTLLAPWMVFSGSPQLIFVSLDPSTYFTPAAHRPHSLRTDARLPKDAAGQAGAGERRGSGHRVGVAALAVGSPPRVTSAAKVEIRVSVFS